MKGTIVGSYRILDTLSVGGMGTVYRAEHTLIGRLAAVKILHPELCANRDIVHRFFNEARTTTSIKHPGIVEVFDFGYMPSGHAYLIMEFLEGMTLSQRVRARGAIPEGEAALVLRSVCIALAAAHDKGVIHRDLKPDNVFVIPDPDSVLGERTKILDFGIAKLTDIGLAGTATKTGAVMGTPTYMSPEQCRGTGDVDFRADLYSIGCMFYELVAGRPPFVRTGAGELIGSHLFVEPEPPSRHVAGLSPDTESLIMSLLAKQPEQRVQSAKELAQRLALIAQQHGWLVRGDISHPSLNHVAIAAPAGHAYPGGHATPAPPTPTPPMVTPMTPTVTPVPPVPPMAPSAALLATTVTPAGAPMLPPVPPDAAQKPTTLSGTASQVGGAPRRSRRGLGIAIAGGLVAAAAGVAAFVAFGSARSGVTRSSAAQPASEAPAAPPAPPAPAPPAPPREIEPVPATAPPAADPAPVEQAAATAHEASPPAAPGSSTSATAPAPPSPAIAPGSTPGATPAAGPTEKPPAKPPRKPARRRDKAGSASERKDLLEQDI